MRLRYFVLQPRFGAYRVWRSLQEMTPVFLEEDLVFQKTQMVLRLEYNRRCQSAFMTYLRYNSRRETTSATGSTLSEPLVVKSSVDVET